MKYSHAVHQTSLPISQPFPTLHIVCVCVCMCETSGLLSLAFARVAASTAVVVCLTMLDWGRSFRTGSMGRDEVPEDPSAPCQMEK